MNKPVPFLQILPAIFFLLAYVVTPQCVYALTCNWNGGSGNWNDPANWSCGVVPDADDDVFIQTGHVVTLDIATTIQSLTISSNSTLTLDVNLSLTGNLEMSGSGTTINGAGDLSIGGNFTWTRGTISGTGALALSGELLSNNGNCTLSRSALSLTSGGSLTGTLFTQTDGASLIIPAGQTLTVSNNSTFSGNLNNTSVNIEGTIETGGAGVVDIKWNTVTNSGTINVNGSNFRFTGGPNSDTDHSGATFNIPSGKWLEIIGGTTHNISDNSSISGAGLFKVTGSSVNVHILSGTTITTNVEADANLYLNVAQTFPALSVNGTLHLNEDLTVSGDLELSGGAVNGTGNLTINGNMTWSFGIYISGSGALTLAGSLTATQSGTLGRSLSLTSGATFTNFELDITDNAILEVPAGQTLDLVLPGATKTWDGNTAGTIDNKGSINLTGNGLIYWNRLSFINTDTLSLDGPDMIIGNGSSSTCDGATIWIGTGSYINFGGLDHTLENTAVTGPGPVTSSCRSLWLNSGSTIPGDITLSGDSLVLNSPQTFASFNVGNGKVILNDSLSIAGALTWSGGDFQAPIARTIPVGGMTEILSTKTISNITFLLNGGGNWVNPIFTMENNAAFVIGAGQMLTINPTFNRILSNGAGGGGTLINYGHIAKVNSGIYTIETPYTAAVGSLTDIQEGTLKFDNTLDNSGTTKGNGTIDLADATVTSYGTFSPGASPGTLTVTGNYTNSLLNIEIEEGPPVAFDQLIVTDTAFLGDTLNLIETGNIPSGSYPILVAGTISGNFDIVNLPACYALQVSGDTLILQKGVSKIWDGSTNTWSNATSWIPNGVPCPDDDVTISSGVCNLDVQPEMTSLTISGGELKKVGAAIYATSAPTLVDTNGVLHIDEGTLEFNGSFENNGCIKGNGTLDTEDATVLGYGKVAPGASTGTLETKGTYCNEELSMELNGNDLPVNDLLEVTEMVELGGILDISYLGGTLPPATRVLVECPTPGCMSGSFATINYPPECQGSCSVTVNDQQVLLTNTLPIEFIGTCTWLGSTGNWSEPANWSCNDVPGSNDTVVINNGQVTLDTSVAVASLSMSGGEIAGAHQVTINGLFSWSGGTLANGDTTEVEDLLLSGTSYLSSGVLLLGDSATWSNADLTMSENAVFEVLQGGVFSATANLPCSILAGSGGGNLKVAGLFQKDGASTMSIDVNFQLSGGSLKIGSGVLDLNGDFTYSGTVSGTDTLDLSDATVQALPGGNYSPGLSPGKLTVEGNYTNNILNMEVIDTGSSIEHDVLEVSGDIQLNGSTFNLLPAGTVPAGTFELITFAGNPGNSEFSISNFSLCGNCSLVYEGNRILLSNTQSCVNNLMLENAAIESGIYRSLGDAVANSAMVETGSIVVIRSDTGVLLQQDVTVEAGGVLEIKIENCQ